jgi:hypothetical protein
MDKLIRIDGTDFVIGSDAHMAKMDAIRVAAVAVETKRADEAAALAVSEKARADKAEGAMVELTKQIATANDPKRIDTLITTRIALIDSARTVLGAEYKADGKTDRQIREDVVRKTDEKADFTGKSDEYVSGRFDTAIKASPAATGLEATRLGIAGVNNAADDHVDDAPTPPPWRAPLAVSKDR